MSYQRAFSSLLLVGCLALAGWAQSGPGFDASTGTGASVVPRLIKFSGQVNPQITQIQFSSLASFQVS